MKTKEDKKIEVVVEYSNKRIDKISLAELFYDIMEQNLRKGATHDEKEDNCA